MEGERHLPIEFSNHMHDSLTHLQEKIGELKHTMNEKDCCILNDFEEVNKLFKSIHHSTATFYLQLYLEPYTKDLEILTACAQSLSEKRHGALIAIKRNNELETLVHSGIPLHAKLSPSLLEAIFYPGNPLHDGGVLIEGDSIISAGNIFPSSVHYKGKEKLGTRHRAAIGLSEISDALVIVVSEETGRISFALGGGFISDPTWWNNQLGSNHLKVEESNYIYENSSIFPNGIKMFFDSKLKKDQYWSF